MPKNKMITKSCPKCVHQLAVACKTCPCGHNFVSARQKANSSLELKEDGSVKRRRTERVKREKPNYYDALEYEKQTKKQRRNRNSVLHGVRKKGDSEDGRHRLKKKRKKHAEKDQPEEKDIPLHTPITPENTLKCFVILAELNRKMGATSWRV